MLKKLKNFNTLGEFALDFYKEKRKYSLTLF